MCGIVGIASFRQAVFSFEKNLTEAVKKLSQRGPDFSNIFMSQNVALGHTRLAIIDTSAEANQPFFDESKNVVIVFNGEIYNFKEIKKNLEQKGYTFKTKSDTEVLLYLYIDEGVNFLHQINGDFAFAIYDKRNETLLIARDRYGVKPLYYTFLDGRLHFSSEIKGLLPLLNFIPEMNWEAFLLYLQLNYIPAPLSIYNNIYKLKPGQYIIFKNNEYKIKTYYEIPENINEQITENLAIETFRNLLSESVNKRLISDVPIGCFLSGGIDSSIITAIAKELKPDIETFTISFKDNSFFDESSDAEIVAKHLKTYHHTIAIEEDNLIELIPDIFNYLDEPFADSSAIAMCALTKYTKKHITVALSGDGGDELLGGYNKHYAHALAFKYYHFRHLLYPFSGLLKILPQSRGSIFSNKIRQLKKFSDGLKFNHTERYWHWATTLHKSDLNKLLKKCYENSDFSCFLKTDAFTLHNVLLNDLHLVLPNDMLYKTDFTSMMNSLEVRVPMIDKDLVNFTVTLPINYKIKSKDRKIILKKAFGHLLPQSTLNKPKQGFEVPLQQWLKKSLVNLLSQYSEKSFIDKQQIFDYEYIQNLMYRLHSVRPLDSAIHLWNFIIFQHWWKKTYL
jgi:asparagine synthase (glutamine-hydrolysing)